MEAEEARAELRPERFAPAESQQQQQLRQKVQDKRFQELRAFALEYVKQIVAKASELSQERQEARNAQKLAQFYTGASYESQEAARREAQRETCVGQVDVASKRLVREAAVQINEKFHLDQNQSVQRVARGEREQEQERPSKWPASKRDKQNSIRLQTNNERGGGAAADGQTSAGRRERARDKRKLFERLNWHLLVACFSTCLPQTLADTIPSSGRSRARTSAL